MKPASDEAMAEIRREMERSRSNYNPEAWNVVHDELERLRARVESAVRNETAAISERDKLRADLELRIQQLQAACAEMRSVLADCPPARDEWLNKAAFMDFSDRYKHALSADCGTALLKELEQWRELAPFIDINPAKDKLRSFKAKHDV